MTALTQAAPLHFIKFDIQRCIRIVTENGHRLLPVHAQQREDVLAPVAGDEVLSGEDYSKLSLIEIEEDGVYTAVLDTEDGVFFELASDLKSCDFSHTFSDGSYGGVHWRVVGYLSDMPADPMQLCSGNDEAGIRSTLGAFQLLLDAAKLANAPVVPKTAEAPVRVVVSHNSGKILDVNADGSVEVVLADFDAENLSDKARALGHESYFGSPVALESTSTMHKSPVNEAIVAHYFDQLKSEPLTLNPA